jgi:hypothetical protein
LGAASVTLGSVCVAASFGGDGSRGAVDQSPACHYQGDAYSAGALLRMGRIEKVCHIVDGVAAWVRG